MQGHNVESTLILVLTTRCVPDGYSVSQYLAFPIKSLGNRILQEKHVKSDIFIFLILSGFIRDLRYEKIVRAVISFLQ